VRFTRQGSRLHKTGDVVLALLGHDIIRVRTLPHDTKIKSRFLFDFAARTILNTFTPTRGDRPEVPTSPHRANLAADPTTLCRRAR
jgi:hypothetical protein